MPAESSESETEVVDAPLIDATGAAVKKLVQKGKEKGYVTYDDLNSALPPEEVSSEQIEDTMSRLNELGINVVDDEDSEDVAENMMFREDDDYKEFFQKALKKWGVSSPKELEGGDKKEFYDYVDRNWKADKETD